MRSAPTAASSSAPSRASVARLATVASGKRPHAVPAAPRMYAGLTSRPNVSAVPPTDARYSPMGGEIPPFRSVVALERRAYRRPMATHVSLAAEVLEPDTGSRPSIVGAHLVGSVPLGSAHEVFRRTASALGDRVRRLPDGETGPRSDWILWQDPVFSALPQFEVGPPGPDTYRTLPKLRLRAGERAEDVAIGNLGFADAALASYKVFAQLKRDGAVPSHVRFQLALPTPLAPISAFIDAEHQAQIEPLYEACVLRELTAIFAAVPRDQLALQWDTRLEFAMLEGV